MQNQNKYLHKESKFQFWLKHKLNISEARNIPNWKEATDFPCIEIQFST